VELFKQAGKQFAVFCATVLFPAGFSSVHCDLCVLFLLLPAERLLRSVAVAVEALRQERVVQASRDEYESYRGPLQPTEARQNLREEEDRTNESSLSWGLLGLGALALLAILSGSSDDESAYPNSGSSYGGSFGGVWSDQEEHDPWDDVPVDGSIGCAWGDQTYGTCR
jgi:hypothetical protein